MRPRAAAATGSSPRPPSTKARFCGDPAGLRIYLNPSDSGAVVKKWLIFIRSCANLRRIDRRRSRHEGRLPGSIRKIPHDAQVRRISWVRGVGRPALAHSGLLVPLPNADRPPSSKQNIRTSCQGTKDSDFFACEQSGLLSSIRGCRPAKATRAGEDPFHSYIWRTRGLRQDPAPPVKTPPIRRENGSGDQ